MAHLSAAVAGAQVVALGVVPALFTAYQFHGLVAGHALAVDYTHGPWIAGRRLFAGHSPYVSAQSPQLGGITFVYPAAAALLLAPFSLLGSNQAGALFTLLNILAILLTLRALDVTDWRVYGISLMWPSVIAGWETANITLLLGLGIAGVWRYRAHPVVCGGLVALLISVKIFLWPLALWLVATRRYRSLGHAVTIGVALNALAWSILGFGQVARYDQLVRALAINQASRGYSVVALAMHCGLDRAAAEIVMAAACAAAACVCIAAGRRRGGQAALGCCVAACMLTSPVSWLHYFALLVVPLAIARPRLSLLWLTPLLFQLPTVGPDRREIAIAFALTAALTALVVRSPDRDRPAPGRRWPPRADTKPR